jgi:DNA mismatch endonuclease (patch repair protein)
MERVLKATLPGGQFDQVSLVRSRTMAAVKGKHNRTTEIQFRMALVRAGIRGWQTHAVLPGKPDVYFPKTRVAVFIDGCFWHGCKRCGHIPKTNSVFWATKINRNQMRDRKNTLLLRRNGIRVIRTWEHSLSRRTKLERVVKQLRSILSESKQYGN